MDTAQHLQQALPQIVEQFSRECAWCRIELAPLYVTQKNPAPPPSTITHGICRPCAEKHFFQVLSPNEKGAVQHLLNLLETPNTID